MADTNLREISMSEVKKHNKSDNCWMVIDNCVYDVTSYMEEHPGGEDSLMEGAGVDATEAFEDIGHSDDARALLKKFKIGVLPESDINSTNSECKIKCLKWGLAALGAALITAAVLKKTLGS